jgi:hypothetical protein
MKEEIAVGSDGVSLNYAVSSIAHSYPCQLHFAALPFQ